MFGCMQSLFIYNLLTYHVKYLKSCFIAVHSPFLFFTQLASKRRVSIRCLLRKYQDQCRQQRLGPALVRYRSCGFGSEDLFEQRM